MWMRFYHPLKTILVETESDTIGLYQIPLETSYPCGKRYTGQTERKMETCYNAEGFKTVYVRQHNILQVKVKVIV